MMKLNDFEIEVLANLPVAPIGLSIPELADGLLAKRDPQARSKISVALNTISAILGVICVTIGNDDFGNCGVVLYGVRALDMPLVRRFCARAGYYR